MASSPPVMLRGWTDYDVNPHVGHAANIFTMTRETGAAVNIFLGLLIGLNWPSAAAIFKRTGAWIRYWFILSRRPRQGPEPERQVLLDRSRTESTTDDSPSPQATLPGTVATVILFILCVGYAFGSGAIGLIQVSTLGLSDAKSCGFWELRSNAGQRIQENDDLIQAKKEARAAQYGRSCYGERSTASPDECSFFQSPQIDYSISKVDCPFDCPDPDQCICANGIFGSAIHLTTTPFSANKIGLNGANLPQIKRNSTFVPLNIDYGFVNKSASDFDYKYYLGSVNTSGGSRNYTFAMDGDPFTWDIAAYSVSLYESSPSGQEYDAWQPISALNRRNHTYMTVIFISPCKIFYTGRCEDPVFPALDQLADDDHEWPSPRFNNEDRRARVLIAIDEMQICPHEESECYPPDEEFEQFGMGYEFARTALRRTSSYKSLEFRLGSGLVATESLSDFESRPLDKEQWIIESQGLFNTSLARLQFNALDIAVGDRPVGEAAAGYEDAYHDTTPDWAKGRLCRMYKFHLSHDYVNISVPNGVGFAIGAVFLFVLGRKTSRPLEMPTESRLRGNWLVLDKSIHFLYVKGRSLCEQLKRKAQRPEQSSDQTRTPETAAD